MDDFYSTGKPFNVESPAHISSLISKSARFQNVIGDIKK